MNLFFFENENFVRKKRKKNLLFQIKKLIGKQKEN